MEISQQQSGPATVISIAGSLDAMTAPDLAGFLESQIRQGHHYIVADIGPLEYTSSAGLRVLLNGLKASRQSGGDLRLAAVQSNVNRVLDLAGFTGILKSYPDVQSAVASYSAGHEEHLQ